MKLSLNVLTLLSLALCANALVYYTKMDKGANGCKPKSSAAGKPEKPGSPDPTNAPNPTDPTKPSERRARDDTGKAPDQGPPAEPGGTDSSGGGTDSSGGGGGGGGEGGGGGGGEIKVGEFVNDENTCGVNVCQNTEGDALVLYCQKPAPFEMCSTDGVSTKTPFPECCWTCVAYTNCEETDRTGTGGGGDTGDGGDGGGGDGDGATPDGGGDGDAETRTMPKKGKKNRKAIDFKKY
ncbi:hypothetical protein AWZ03_013274 [Drosophila navojoa]|uniref:Single domain-containing protein n=1 Tax=Drosophila navojoa TaxID=7232 RepID=A0A484AWC1_DRONA|nr:hypothetical protein AWZ03_013274 [Drosophila navojoa]